MLLTFYNYYTIILIKKQYFLQNLLLKVVDKKFTNYLKSIVKLNIQGLKPGTYWLEESAAPKGYNKLTKRIRVDIDENGMMTINTTERFKTEVDVENKSGTILPSTGGMGTTVIYIVGALLVLISGVVLLTKKRADLK